MKKTEKYINRVLEGFAEYTPGEQPQDKKTIKLNTNENPYPSSPGVLRCLKQYDGKRLRLYPDPMCKELRLKIAKRYGFSAGNVFIGNGSDEILRLAVLAFSDRGENVVFPYPSYPLYETISSLSYCRPFTLELKKDFSLPEKIFNGYTGCLKIIANPNSPTGTFYRTDDIEKIVKRNRKVVVLDEAYVDFAEDNCLRLVKKYDNLLVARTLSKSFSLAGIRIGYCFGSKNLINILNKIKDSYNVSRLSQEMAVAAIEDYGYMLSNRKRIIKTREYLKKELEKMNFFVFDSRANFLFVKPPLSAEKVYERLKKKGILVRFFKARRLQDCLRISIGTEKEINSLLNVLKNISARK